MANSYSVCSITANAEYYNVLAMRGVSKNERIYLSVIVDSLPLTTAAQ